MRVSAILWEALHPTLTGPGHRTKGLLKTQHLIVALRQGPLPFNQIWDQVKEGTGIRSRNQARELLGWLKRQGRITTRPSKEDKNGAFLYMLIHHKLNNFSLPAEFTEQNQTKIT
jgi:hypothetical protein